MMAVLIITVTAFLLGLLIVFVSEKFKSDDKSAVYEKHLPGYNCGVCGYGTCIGLAKEMEKDAKLYEKCKPLRGEAKEKMEEYLREENLL